VKTVNNFHFKCYFKGGSAVPIGISSYRDQHFSGSKGDAEEPPQPTPNSLLSAPPLLEEPGNTHAPLPMTFPFLSWVMMTPGHFNTPFCGILPASRAFIYHQINARQAAKRLRTLPLQTKIVNSGGEARQ